MKISFLNKERENTRLILIVAGWSAGAEIGRGISLPGWDVAVVHDFSELTFDNSVLGGYYTIYLFGWSLGVFASSQLIDPARITAAYAINGTLAPVDDELGIPCGIYESTLKGLNERNLFKFRHRMTENRQLTEFLTNEGANSITNLQQQLRNIRDAHRQSGKSDSSLPWVRAFVSGRDRIFPPVNQRNAWAGEDDVEIIELDAPHYVDLKEIVRMVIADTSTVSRRFSRASVSYDTHAIAQYSAAIKLASYLHDYTEARDGSVLEIGCGTGLFTREYSRFIHPGKATFVDITSTGPFGIAPVEEYVVMDAEEWVVKNADKYDFIVSASAIQWFADKPRFLHLCDDRLAEGGVLAISTFLPGNMEELDAVRPNPLQYPGSGQLAEWLKRDYDDVRVIEDEIKVEFQSVRAMLMHLKHTGVAGSAPSSHLPMKDMSHLRSLTYRPVYLLARKRVQRN